MCGTAPAQACAAIETLPSTVLTAPELHEEASGRGDELTAGTMPVAPANPFQHPLLRPCGAAESEAEMEDVFGALDAFLESEFGELSESPLSESPRDTRCEWGLPAAAKPAAVHEDAPATGPMPRWKLYHMQRRQELLAPSRAPAAAASPASASTASDCTQQGAGAVAAPASPSHLLPMCRAGSASTATSGLMAPAAGPATVATLPDQLLVLNALQQQQEQQQQQLLLLQQQQHLLMLQQQTAAAGAKRALVADDVLAPPPAAKRPRAAAAGTAAAENMYGLPAEQPLQLFHLASLQAPQAQGSYHQQVEQYQQQQLQALHQQLQLRLQVQQQQAVQVGAFHHGHTAPLVAAPLLLLPATVGCCLGM